MNQPAITKLTLSETSSCPLPPRKTPARVWLNVGLFAFLGFDVLLFLARAI